MNTDMTYPEIKLKVNEIEAKASLDVPITEHVELTLSDTQAVKPIDNTVSAEVTVKW